jgi:ABC-type dipeptide/oligopeptide/nickel transport system permease component
MLRYLIRRLLQAIPTLLGISILSFVLVSAVPGDPITVRTFVPNMTEETRAILRRQLGLDQSAAVQYVRWLTGVIMRPGDVAVDFARDETSCRYVQLVGWTFCGTGGGVLRGDLGTSLDTKQPVLERVLQRVPATLELGISSLILALLVGAPLGLLAAVRRGSIFDGTVRVFSAITQSLPPFWTALLLILVFSTVLGLFPAAGRQSATLSQEFDLADRLRHLFLPALALALPALAGFSRLVRTETLEVMGSDYIRTAQAKGLRPINVWYVHTFRNALIPLMTVLGPAIVGVLGGAVITEVVFAWPGMGRLTVNAVLQKDFPLVLGAGMVFAVLTIIGNLLSDLFYALVDPRVRLS